MADIVFIAITLAFFAICMWYVQWCDHIMGPDDFELEQPSEDNELIEEVAA